MKNRYLALLQRRPHYRSLWLASVISLLGDWFNTIASVILVSRYTDGGTEIGALFLARALPPFIFGPIAGVVADRFDRKTTLIFTDIARAIIVLGFLFVDRPERVWIIYVLTVAQFTISALFEPAKAAIIPTLVEGDEELLIANTLSSATWSAMLTLGAAIGGITAAIFGISTALIIDSATFLLSAFFLSRLPSVQPVVDSAETKPSGWQDFTDGLRYIRAHRDIGMLALVKAFAQIGSTDILIAIYASDIFPVGLEGATTLGLLFAASGVGAVSGPILASYLSDGSSRQLQIAIGVGFGFIAIGWLIFGWAPTLPMAMFGLFIRFIGGSIGWTYSSVLLQIKAPNNLLGRVFSVDFGLFTLAMAIGVWSTGVILDVTAISARQISMLFGIASFSAVLFWIFAMRVIAKRERNFTETVP